MSIVVVIYREQVKSILEDLDDAEYYGSDHEERESRAVNGAGAKETVEEELARLVRRQERDRQRDRQRKRGECGERDREVFDVEAGAAATKQQYFAATVTVVGETTRMAETKSMPLSGGSVTSHDVRLLLAEHAVRELKGQGAGQISAHGV